MNICQPNYNPIPNNNQKNLKIAMSNNILMNDHMNKAPYHHNQNFNHYPHKQDPSIMNNNFPFNQNVQSNNTINLDQNNLLSRNSSQNYKQTAYENRDYSKENKKFMPKKSYNNNDDNKRMYSRRKSISHSNENSRKNNERKKKVHKYKEKSRSKSSSNSRSSSSVKIKYVSFNSKHRKINNISHVHCYSSLSSSSSSSYSSDSSKSHSKKALKKKTLNYDLDGQALANNAQSVVKLNRNLEKQVISYKVVGNEKPLISQEKNLFDKLRQFLPNEKKNNKSEEQNIEGFLNENEINSMKKDEKIIDSKDIQLSQEKIDEEALNIEKNQKEWLEPQKNEEIEVDEFNYENRYFIKNPTKICFRCHQIGHYEKTCSEELIWRTQCLNCLGDHRPIFCNSIVCFKCSKIGHKNKDCPEKVIKNCHNCRKIGHEKKNCGIVEFNKNYGVNKAISPEDQALLICFVCFKRGENHVNCKKINIEKNRKIDDLYEGEVTFQNENESIYWRNDNKQKKNVEERKKFNYHKLEQHAIDTFDELENF